MDISFIVARAEIDFKAQIELEPIEIAVRVGEMRTTSFDTLYEIRNKNGAQLAATGRVVLVLFDWKSHAKLPIPDDLREKVRTLFGRE
jgi:acyl-CoA thioesterase FadM